MAKLDDGRTVEMHYQCDVKAYDPGGVNWRLGKGKPPKDTSLDLYGAYKALWNRWAALNPNLIAELRVHVSTHENRLSDLFGTTPISQARALADILNAP